MQIIGGSAMEARSSEIGKAAMPEALSNRDKNWIGVSQTMCIAAGFDLEGSR